MKKYSIQKKTLFMALVLSCSLNISADATLDRITQLTAEWAEYLSSVQCMVFIADIDGTFFQSDDKELIKSCDLVPGGTYQHFFYIQFLQLICNQPNCYVIFNTARPYVPVSPGQSIQARADETIKKSNIKSSYTENYVRQFTNLGIDLNESPKNLPFAGKPDDWLVLWQRDGARALIPKPHILITGSGSFIQVGSKVNERIDPAFYNSTVEQWITADEEQLDVLHQFWEREKFPVSPITPATYSQLFLIRQLQGPVFPRPLIPDDLLPESSLLVWPAARENERSFPVQNLTMNKGYAAQWILMKLQEIGLISPPDNNVICICGDSEGDLPMMKLDLRGAALKSFDKCTPGQMQLLRYRLSTLGITEILPGWISKAWTCSAVPGVNTITNSLLEGNCQSRLAQTAESGVLPMLESMLAIAKGGPKMDSTMLELMSLMENRQGGFDEIVQSQDYTAATMAGRKRRSVNRSFSSTDAFPVESSTN
ncbi:hypothetical protein ACWJJH_19350 [Endozoicomonadaceae bacterium StTr2]